MSLKGGWLLRCAGEIENARSTKSTVAAGWGQAAAGAGEAGTAEVAAVGGRYWWRRGCWNRRHPARR